MHIITAARLRQFYEKHTDATDALKLWLLRARRGWQSFTDVQKEYPKASLAGRFTVFRIKGNHYRLIVRIEYEKQRIYIRHVLTHEEYNKQHWKKDEWY